MQELYQNALEKQELVQKIKAAGFTILGTGDLAIAYRTEKFEFTGKSGVTSRINPAFYACLKEKTSGKEICVVSNHAKGFDARMQKLYTQALKQKPVTNPLENLRCDPLREGVQRGSVEERIKDYKARATRTGDNSIKESLTFLENQMSTDLFVYGLDANTTAKYLDLDSRVHPKRLEQFTQKGWVCDAKDKEPTIVDHHLDQSLCKKI